MPRPAVRDIDAYYEDGVFYGVTYALSNKMKEISANSEPNYVRFSKTGMILPIMKTMKIVAL